MSDLKDKKWLKNIIKVILTLLLFIYISLAANFDEASRNSIMLSIKLSWMPLVVFLAFAFIQLWRFLND